MKTVTGIFLSVLLGACANAPLAPTAPAAAALPPPTPESTGLHWFRDAAEQRVIYLEIYRMAASSVRVQSAGLAPRSWGVILDVDETILDNSDYNKRTHEAFDKATWATWVNEKHATLLPGTREFIRSVQDLNGRVVLVTNRDESACAVTEANLKALGITYDLILCDKAGDQDKNSRFEAVQTGATGALPAIKVLAWVGDNIKDFPKLSQQSVGDLEAFGARYFVLPNPMYGSWVGNPYR